MKRMQALWFTMEFAFACRSITLMVTLCIFFIGLCEGGRGFIIVLYHW